MAEQGGYRRPGKQESFSGVGSRSRRTDKQVKASPNVQDSEDLQVGDRRKIEQGQRVAPLPRSAGPAVAPPQQGASPALGPSGMAEMPGFLASLPSTRPGEDEMTQPQNVPDPDDDKEFVLQMLASAPWGNEKVRQMLNDLRTERSQVAAPTVPGIVPNANLPSGPLPQAPEPQGAAGIPSEPEPIELGADTEQPLPEEDVEDELLL